MISIENEILRVQIAEKGAELQSIFHKQNEIEYMWSGDSAFWGKHSPVLFPIVGTLKNNTYFYKEKSYKLSRHGFARDMLFEIAEQNSHSVTLSLKSDTTTLTVFPFEFLFSIQYTLQENKVSVKYIVHNKGNEAMYFSVGGHPAFKIPLTANTTYTDYRLTFNRKEQAGRWPLSSDGLILEEPLPLLDGQDVLPLDKSLFYTDAIVLKNLESTSVNLESSKTPHGLEVNFTGFPYLGIWAAKDADFVCIEPWCGIADSIAANQQLADKEGVEKLDGRKAFEREWSVWLF